ncbi:MAG: hypothetical protein GY774_06045 [Planctomycetes bacterium]|nr:hypothetical protein [Planctomycetota bacterium]
MSISHLRPRTYIPGATADLDETKPGIDTTAESSYLASILATISSEDAQFSVSPKSLPVPIRFTSANNQKLLDNSSLFSLPEDSQIYPLGQEYLPYGVHTTPAYGTNTSDGWLSLSGFDFNIPP